MTDNVWSFIRGSYQMMYRGRDESRLPTDAYAKQIKLYNEDYIRFVEAPNGTSNVDAEKVVAETAKIQAGTAAAKIVADIAAAASKAAELEAGKQAFNAQVAANANNGSAALAAIVLAKNAKLVKAAEAAAVDKAAAVTADAADAAATATSNAAAAVHLAALDAEGRIFAETMNRNGVNAPEGSKLFLKANFSASDYPSLLNSSRKLGSKWGLEHQPDACHKMTPLERRGVSAFEQGIDYLPEIPVYSNADKTAGFVFGNNIVVGAMQVRHVRRMVVVGGGGGGG